MLRIHSVSPFWAVIRDVILRYREGRSLRELQLLTALKRTPLRRLFSLNTSDVSYTDREDELTVELDFGRRTDTDF